MSTKPKPPIDRHDAAGQPIGLDALCRLEPEWAANRIRHLEFLIETNQIAANPADRKGRQPK